MRWNPLRRRVRPAEAIPATKLGVTPQALTICSMCGEQQATFDKRGRRIEKCRRCHCLFLWWFPAPPETYTKPPFGGWPNST